MNQQEQADHILRTFGLFSVPDGVLEIRGLKIGRYRDTAAGYFDADSAEKFAAAVQRLAVASPKGIYSTLNPVRLDLLSRYANRLEMKAEATTKDADILRRRWILIDADPERPAEISSNEAEHDAAIATATACRDLWRDTWGVDAVLADSGNGGHVLIPCDLPNDADGQKIVCGVLARMAAMFDTETVKIDTGVHNASRICKVYGTLARKGDSTPERPHRYSRLLDVPAVLSPAPSEILRELCEEEAAPAVLPVSAPSARSTASSKPGPAPFDLRAFIAQHGIAVRGESDRGAWHHWNLEACPFNPEHRHPDSMITQHSSGALTFKCQHQSCGGNDWRALRKHFEPGWTPFDPNRMPGARSLQATKTTMRAPSAPPACSEDPEEAKQEEYIRQRLLDAELATEPQNDIGNARRLVRRYGSDLLYDHDSNRWFIWDGKRFRPDIDGEIFRRCAAVAASIYAEAATIEATGEEDIKAKQKSHRNFASRTESKAGLSNMEWAARSLLPVNFDQLDADPFCLPVSNGLLDLRTGNLLPHDRAALNTKLVDIVYDPTATCPRWEAFLKWTQKGDSAMVSFLQMAVGYTLTGDVREHCLLFLYGKGRNGKSTFVDVLELLLGEYASNIKAEVLLKDMDTGERASPGIAKLRGKRFVSVSEMEASRRMDEALVKSITSGDTITARFMRQDEISFKPTFKLFWFGNSYPGVVGTDDGIWSRMRIIPFLNQIQEEEKDTKLLEKLAAELPGILVWAVQGCLAWQAAGKLETPKQVKEATESLRTMSDPIGMFLSDRCEFGPDFKESPVNLRVSYEAWCNLSNKTPFHPNTFSNELEKRGFASKPQRFHGVVIRMRLGLKLREIEQEEEGVTDSPAVTDCNSDSGTNRYTRRQASVNTEKSVTVCYKAESLLQTESEEKKADIPKALEQFGEMIEAAKERKIPIKMVRVGAGDCENLNTWVNIQVKRFTEAEDEDDKGATMVDMRACFAAWCGLRAEEQTP